MGVKKIDAFQTAQILALEADVGDLRTKLNQLVADVTDIDGVDGATRDGLSKKLNTLIGDLNDFNNLIIEGYTTPGSSESYGILEALDVYKDAFKDHVETYSADTIHGWPSVPQHSWDWWHGYPFVGGGGSGTYNSTAIYGTVTGASWSSGSNALSFTGTTGTITYGQRLMPENETTRGAMLAHGEEKVFIIDFANTGSPIHLSNSFINSGSTNSIGFNAAPGTIKYSQYYDEIWLDYGPWPQDSFEHPVYGRSGHTHTKSGSAGAASYDNPALGGTAQGGTVADASAVADNANVIGLYNPNSERLISIESEAVTRAKKLVRKTLNTLRSK